jgi:hypothetical protein
MKSRSLPDPIDGALLVALVAVVLSVTYAYVTVERAFYYWDLAVYHDLARTVASAFHQSWGTGWGAVRRSLGEDYNALFAVPLVPFLDGRTSRLAYTLSLALVYLVPFALCIGALATRVVVGPTREVFWTAAGLTLLVPMSWVPTLRGYPDTGAASLVVLAAWIYTRAEGPHRARDSAAIGFLLALAALFRRPFVYAALAFVASAVVFEITRAVLRRRRGEGDMRTDGAALAVRFVAGTAAAIVVVAALGRDFVVRLRTYDFVSLYRAYEEHATVVFAWYWSAYGPAALALAAGGAIAAWRARLLQRSGASFLALLAAVSVVQWLFAVRQLGEQYTVQFTPFLVLGLAALLWTIWRLEAPLRRALARTAFAAALAANVVFGLTSVATDSSVRHAFGGSWLPLVREDYGTLAEFAEYLRQTSNPGRGIYVVASSHTISPDLLRHVESALHDGDTAVDFLSVPTVDSRDYYPLDALLEAEHVVVVMPLQTHLRPEEQRILSFVYDLFTTGGELAQDFEMRPDSFTLQGGARISVYSRRRATSLPTALRTLEAIEREIPVRPGQQADWIVVNRRFRAWVSRNPDGSTEWVAHPSPRGQTPSTVVAWLGPPPGPAEILGTVTFVDGRCQGATLAFATADEEGRLSPLAAVQRRPGQDGHFQVAVTPEKGRLVISLLDYAEGASIDFCLLIVDPLVLRPMPR